MSKYTVLVTSAIYTNYGIYDKIERIKQTTATVESARKYIPNSTIILIDNSKEEVQQDTSEEFEALIDAVDYYIDNSSDPDIKHFHDNITNYDIGKNSMECLGMFKALNYIATDADIMNEITASNRIFKLSGRYQVTDKFDITKFDNESTVDKYVFKKAQPSWITPEWTGVNSLLQTRLWSFPPSQFMNTVNLFQVIIKNMFETFKQGRYIDVEHSMSKFIPSEQLVELETVGLQGNIAPNGMMVID